MAQQEDMSHILDGIIAETKVEPILSNGKIFFPAREIVEALGGRITWFPALKLLNINMSDRTVSVVMNTSEAEVNGKKVILEYPPNIINDRVMIPFKVVSLLIDTQAALDKETVDLSIARDDPSITSIRSYSYPDKTRIVIDVTEQTNYNTLSLTNPERIVVDVKASIRHLKAEEKELNINDLLINRVRTGQFDNNTARIVADLKSKQNYDVFELSSPQRIVLDIYYSQESSQEQIVNHQTPIIISPKNEETIVIGEGNKDNGKFVVVIDPGHGGSQPGAIGPSGLKEKDVVLDIGLKVTKMLQNEGFTVYMTREKDIDVPLESRPLVALQKKADVFVSIHINSALQKGSPTARGVESYVLNSRYIGASAKDVADRENKASQYHDYEDNILNQIIADLEESASIGFSLDLADIVQRKLVQNTGLESRGVKQAPFIVLKGVNMAAVLVEVGFISNPNEEKLLNTSEFREKIAQALSQSIKEYVKNMPENI